MNNYSSSINYGREQIAFQVIYTARKTMEIAVHPGARVIVKAPTGTVPQQIEGRIVKRARWIKKQFDFFRQFEPRSPSR